MKLSKELLEEMQNFDYASLFNQELEDITPVAVEVKEVPTTTTRTSTPLKEGYKHQMARLEQMMAEERGQYISYEQAYNN